MFLSTNKLQLIFVLNLISSWPKNAIMNACNTCNGAADIQHARISQYKNLQKQEVNHYKKGIKKLKYGQNF